LLLGGGHGGAREMKNSRGKRGQQADVKMQKGAIVVAIKAK
jgi:hypothetical protein